VEADEDSCGDSEERRNHATRTICTARGRSRNSVGSSMRLLPGMCTESTAADFLAWSDRRERFQVAPVGSRPVADLRGSSGAQALANTLDLARSPIASDTTATGRRAHGGPMLAGRARGADRAIAAATERIRVGSGGVMLPHYSPSRSRDFSLLADCSGAHRSRHRRAAGTDPLTTSHCSAIAARQRPMIPEQLAELLGYLNDQLPPSTPSRGWQDAPGSRISPSPGCSDRLRKVPYGRPSSACPMRSPTSSTRAALRSRRSTASASPNMNTPGAAPHAWPCG